MTESGDALLFEQQEHKGNDRDDGFVASRVLRLQYDLFLGCGLRAYLEGTFRRGPKEECGSATATLPNREDCLLPAGAQSHRISV